MSVLKVLLHPLKSAQHIPLANTFGTALEHVVVLTTTG